MLTYELKKSPGLPLYESLYRCIRWDILSGKLPAGEKLPSKRALAAHLEVSKITVETAYSQLLAEGYIRSREKVGYFVEALEHAAPTAPALPPHREAPAAPALDLTGGGSQGFPFSVWSRLQREVMLDYGEKLLLPLPNTGVAELRQAIAAHLAAFRGMRVEAENILIGAGTDFLYNLLIQLLGRDKIYAVEEPGYGKIRQIYSAGDVACVSAPLDGEGVMVEGLSADVLHISPNHHFPTGLVTPLSRRKTIVSWANSGSRWIIEDDYDSEFRFHAHPMPTLRSLDGGQRVIYMNSFSKTLAPSIRISYMVLPRELMAKFQQKLGFYSCTVPSFEQYTLSQFLSRGYFEKHINRMRKIYKNRRNQVISLLENWEYSDKITILEQDAGLHFLLRVDTPLSDDAATAALAARGIRVNALSGYYHGDPGEENRHCLVINYAHLDPAVFEKMLTHFSCLFDTGQI